MENLPQNAVIGLADAGFFSYFYPGRVINLDGLVNEWWYVDACRNGEAIPYLASRGVTHIMTVFGQNVRADESGVLSYRIPAPFADHTNNILRFRREDILYEKDYVWAPKSTVVHKLLLWEFSPPRHTSHVPSLTRILGK